MNSPITPHHIAAEIDSDIRALEVLDTDNIRAIRKRCSALLRDTSGEIVLAVARVLHNEYRHRWVALEIICHHKAAMALIGEAELEEFGRGMDSWGDVDAFAVYLAGAIWLRGQVGDELFHRWATSDNFWWRRAALASTVVLNTPSRGGHGDVPRTLAVCCMLADDHEDMVVKALSWALRKCVAFNPQAVRDFLAEYDTVLAARIKREVENKLRTGLKNPGKSRR